MVALQCSFQKLKIDLLILLGGRQEVGNDVRIVSERMRTKLSSGGNQKRDEVLMIHSHITQFLLLSSTC